MLTLDPVARMLENLAGRLTGPLTLRLIFQPGMALFFGIRDGLKDGKEGRLPFFWAFVFKPWNRRELIRSGWKSIGKVFVMAVIIDAIYQYIALRWFYPGEALTVAFVLACVPYVLIRGPVSRLVRARGGRRDDLGRAA
jgi:hypothetical protein